MAHKVTIECEARFVDHLSDESKRASDSIHDIGSAAEKAQKKVDGLGKKKFKPIFDADNNKFLKKLREAEARAEKLGKTKTTMTLKAVDKATNVIGKALNKAQSFGGSVWNAILKVKDSQAMEALGKVTNAAKSIAGKTWQAIVKIKDYATTPLKKIKDSLFSIKSLIAAVTAGFAAKKFVLDPINLADQYSGAKIGFSTLLGDKKGQEMMDEIDKFAKETPFKTSGVISNVQKMMAYGWDVDRVIKDMETIGDAAASTGRGDQGLESIVYALSEIRSKGKLSTQELNQLASAGIKAKQYLAQGLGYGTDDEGMAKLMKDLEKGAIGANQAIDLILQGMEEFDGMMDRTANETVEGLWSQIQDVFEINILRKWGQGLQDGARKGMGTLVDLLDSSEDALASLGDTLYSVGKSLSNWAADKLEKAVKTIKEVTGSTEFKNASLGGKIKILWNEVIAEPFSEWWNSEGKAKIAGIASDIGKGLGGAITGGLCALLGFNAEDALADGVSIGGSFMDGFLEGFDTDRIGEALKNWVSDNKGLATVLGGVLAWKLITGLASGIGAIKGLFGGKGGTGGGTLLSDAYAATMNVTAGVVNVYGGVKNSASDIVDSAKDTYLTYKALKTGSDVAKAGKLLKAGDTVADGTKLLSGTSNATKLLTAGSKVDDVVDAGRTVKNLYTYTNAAGDVVGSTTKFGAFMGKTGSALAKAFPGIAKVAPKFSKVATKAAPVLSVLDFAVDGVFGYKKAKDEGASTKEAVGKGALKMLTGEYEESGAGNRTLNAVGNTAKWAGAGALIGSVIPGVGTLIGGAVGGGIGLVSNLVAQGTDANKKSKKGEGLASSAIGGTAIEGSESSGGWFSNAWKSTKEFFTDTIPTTAGNVKDSVSEFFTETIPEKWNNFWEPIGSFFSETVPEAAGKAKEKIGTFFTETIPEKWNSFWDPIGNFFTETIPTAWSTLTGKISEFFTVTIPEKWNEFWSGVGNFFTETVPYALGYATGKVYAFFTETIPEKWNSFWDTVGNFFTETIPSWAEFIKEAVVGFFTIKLPEAWNSFWGTISTFFTETVPAWAEGIWNDYIHPFFTETIPQFFGNLWDSISTFFTETLPEWAEGIWNDHVYPFFTETIPGFFSGLWDSIATFFSETLPEWAEGIWNNNIVPFFTETIPGFFSGLWDSISTFFAETLPEWADSTWNNNIVPFFTETIPGFFGTLWESVTGFFNDSIDFIAEQIWAPIRGFFTETIPGWASGAIEKVKSWWSGVKENFMAGFEAGSGGGDSEGGKARGGIIGGTSSMDAFARGGRTDGGIVGGSTRFIRVNEESPEMIIPLSSQRRERAMKLWAKTGQLLGVPGFARGGNTTGDNDEGIRFIGSDHEASGTRSVQVNLGGINIELKVEGTDKAGIVQAIKEQLGDIAESVAGMFADEFEALFENTPVRGEVT